MERGNEIKIKRLLHFLWPSLTVAALVIKQRSYRFNFIPNGRSMIINLGSDPVPIQDDDFDITQHIREEMICDEEVTTGVTTINIITVTGYEIRWPY